MNKQIMSIVHTLHNSIYMILYTKYNNFYDNHELLKYTIDTKQWNFEHRISVTFLTLV